MNNFNKFMSHYYHNSLSTLASSIVHIPRLLDTKHDTHIRDNMMLHCNPPLLCSETILDIKLRLLSEFQ
jgi:hypothetical protein